MEQVFYRFRTPDGAVSDTLTEQQLLDAARSGVLGEETPVALLGADSWLPAWRVPFLAAAFGLTPAAPVALPSPEAPVPRPAPLPSPPASRPHPFGYLTQPLPRWCGGAVLGILALRVFLLVGQAGGTTLATSDGRVKVTVPSGWVVQKDPELELLVEGDEGTSALAVGKIPADPSDPATVETIDYALFRDNYSKVPDLQDHGVRPFEGRYVRGIVHEASGSFGGEPAWALLVTFKVGSDFYRASAVTEPRYARERREMLLRILRSFRPVASG